jgi:hypothetical protein
MTTYSTPVNPRPMARTRPVESYADRIRRNDKSLIEVKLDAWVGGNDAIEILDALKNNSVVKSLKIHFRSPPSQQNGIRRFATVLERCTCITDLRLDFPDYNYQVEFFQILLIESIPKMLGLKKLELESMRCFDNQFFDMMGQCIGGHQGKIEELSLKFFTSVSLNSSSIIVGLTPALRRLKAIRFGGWVALTSQQISELSGVAADCDALEEFGYNLSPPRGISNDDFKAICQLLSKFPSLKRVFNYHGTYAIDKEGRFVAFLEMVKKSKTIEQVPRLQCRNAVEEAAIKYHCRNNMMHNRIHEKSFLAATVPSSAWPLILKEFSDMPDVLYYLLQQKHGAMSGPTRLGCKRKQDIA